MSSAYSAFIIETSFDADLNNKLSMVEYSTSPNEVVTIGHAITHYNVKEGRTDMKKMCPKCIGQKVKGCSVCNGKGWTK